MNKGYSIDLRERVLAYIEQGNSKVKAAEVFQIHRRTIYKWLRLKEETGALSPRKMKEYKVRKLDKAALRVFIEQKPDALLQEMSGCVWYRNSG